MAGSLLINHCIDQDGVLRCRPDSCLATIGSLFCLLVRILSLVLRQLQAGVFCLFK
jgi:hypothetical protein